MTPAEKVDLVLGIVAWLGLGLLFALAIGRAIREADRRRPRPTPPPPSTSRSIYSADAAVLDSVTAFTTGAPPVRRDWFL